LFYFFFTFFFLFFFFLIVIFLIFYSTYAIDIQFLCYINKMIQFITHHIETILLLLLLLLIKKKSPLLKKSFENSLKNHKNLYLMYKKVI